MKTVRRTYTKRSGEAVEKTYTYREPRKVLIDKHGNVNEELYKETIAQMKEEMDFIDYLNAKEDFQQKVEELSYEKKFAHDKSGYKVSTILSKIAGGDVNKMLINAGMDAETIAKMAGVDVEEVLKEENWKNSAHGKKGTPIFVGGKEKWELKFNYKKRSSFMKYNEPEKP